MQMTLFITKFSQSLIPGKVFANKLLATDLAEPNFKH